MICRPHRTGTLLEMCFIHLAWAELTQPLEFNYQITRIELEKRGEVTLSVDIYNSSTGMAQRWFRFI
jgi:hypothetical protein